MTLLTPISICPIFILVLGAAAKPLTSETSSAWKPSEDQHTHFTHANGPRFDADETAYTPDWNRLHKLSSVIEHAEGELKDGERYKGHVHEMLKALNLYQAVRRAISPNGNNQTKDAIYQSGFTANPSEASFDQSASSGDSGDQSASRGDTVGQSAPGASNRCQCLGKRTGRILTGSSEDQGYLSSTTLMTGVVGALWTALAGVAVYYKARLSDTSSSSAGRSLGDWIYQDTNNVDVDDLLGSLRAWSTTANNSSKDMVCGYLEAVWDQGECRDWLRAGWEKLQDWSQSSPQSAATPSQDVSLVDQNSTGVKRWALRGEGSQQQPQSQEEQQKSRQRRSMNFMKRMGTIIQSRTGRAFGALQSAVSRGFVGQSSITNRLSRLWNNKISRSWRSAKNGAMKGLKKLADVSSKVMKSAKSAMQTVQRRIAPYSTEAVADADRAFSHRVAEENPYFTETSSSSNVFTNSYGDQYSEYQGRSDPSAHHYPDYGYHGDDYCDCDDYGHGSYPDYPDLYGETGYSLHPNPETELLEHGITALITSSLWIPAIYLIYLLGSTRSRTLPSFLRFGGPELPANRGSSDQLEGENFIGASSIGGMGPTYHNLDSDELANTLTININMATDRLGNGGGLQGVNVTALPGEDVNVDFLPTYDDVQESGDHEEDFDEEAYVEEAYDEEAYVEEAYDEEAFVEEAYVEEEDSENPDTIDVVTILNGNKTHIIIDDAINSDNLENSNSTGDVNDLVHLDSKNSDIEPDNSDIHGNTTKASNTSTHTFEAFTIRDGVVTLQTTDSEKELSREDKEQIVSDNSTTSDVIGLISRVPGKTNILKFGGSATRFAIMNTGADNATVILPKVGDSAESEEQRNSDGVTNEEESGNMLKVEDVGDVEALGTDVPGEEESGTMSKGEDVRGGEALGADVQGEEDVGALTDHDDSLVVDEVDQDKEGLHGSNSGTLGIVPDDAEHSEKVELRGNNDGRDANIFKTIDNFISKLNSRQSQAT